MVGGIREDLDLRLEFFLPLVDHRIEEHAFVKICFQVRMHLYAQLLFILLLYKIAEVIFNFIHQ